ncbi:hypothetical protein C7S18_08875 [Ahniella affigens]|uniref:Uncharacterized protein n=1 Tax=Ahniella affigens TaxID=2021234 RepID=A0A2P1PR17_9GAMM|nr:hypothetical protein [Ahniella affigens]AVP97297.1 hypothetical protein C7S18_08875 [Ahniella affigens]
MKQKILFSVVAYLLVVVVLLGARGVESAGRILLLGGLLIAVVAQIIGIFLCKAKSSAQAFMILTVPGYFLFALGRAGNYAAFLVVYLIGISSIALGTVLLSSA